MIGTTTALNVIQGSLRKINSYQSGEQIANVDAGDCLDTFNDLLDSLSTSREYIFGVNENILQWISQKSLYTVGNPVCTLVGSQPFTGTLSSGSPTISAITNMPANLVAGSGAAYAMFSGSVLTDTQGLIPPNTTVTAIGSTTVTMSANAIGNSNGLDSITFTVPGDFPIIRPLRITTGYTRFNALDFWLDVAETESQYNSILYKAQPGPWPSVAWYNNKFPYGELRAYMTPGNSAELHLFTAGILGNLTLNQLLIMPQGYARNLKLLLARDLWIEYISPSTIPTMLEKLAGEASAYIKALNARPAAVARYDRELSRGNRPDGGWIMTGGYGAR